LRTSHGQRRADSLAAEFGIMKTTRRLQCLRTLVVASCLLNPCSFARAQPAGAGGNPSVPAADRLDRAASSDRADAAALRARANQWDEMAGKAEARAAKGANGVLGPLWKKVATQNAAEAARLRAQADDVDAQKADTSGMPSEVQKPGSSGSIMAKTTEGPLAGVDATAPAAQRKCAAGAGLDEALPAEEIAGEWFSDDGDIVEVAPAVANDEGTFVLLSKHQWKGSYAAGKLIFSRMPTVEEMSPAAPEWARAQVQGKLAWSLELDAHGKCGEPSLDGKWYPGELQFIEERTPDGEISKRQATVTGRGKPVDVRYTGGPRYFLFARSSMGRQNIKDVYLGVATEIELQFARPHDRPSLPVEVSIGDQRVKLIATKIDAKGHIFRTDAFVPDIAATGEPDLWNPSPSPARTP
jgi:hypothetical protein